MNSKAVCRAAILVIFGAVCISCARQTNSAFGLDGSRPHAQWAGTINTTEETDSPYLFAIFTHEGSTTNVVKLERTYYSGYPKNLIVEADKEVHQKASVTLSQKDMDRIYSLLVHGISGAEVSFEAYRGSRTVTLQLLVGTLNIAVTRAKPYDSKNAINSSAREIMKIVNAYDPKYKVTTER